MKHHITTLAAHVLWLAALVLACVQNPAQGQDWNDPVLIDSNTDTLGINTGAREWCPFISADGNYIYFTRERVNNDLYVCHRTDDGWSPPLRLPFCIEELDERNPSVNATNDTLYFVSWAPGWDIFWSFRTGPEDTSWSAPVRLPEPINSTGIEFAVWATPDNQRLLFASWRISANGEDIYECRRDASAETGWSEPQVLPGELNTGRRESYPTMGEDTTEMFFWRSTSRLYRATLVNGQWTNGDELPANINRVIIRDPSETTPCITPDGHRLYFSSLWNGDSTATAGDIWYSERPLAVRPSAGRPHDRSGFQIEILPNPTNNNFQVRLPERTQRVMIYDLLGRELLREDVPSSYSARLWTPHLEARRLASGVYLLRATDFKNSETVRLHIIK